MITRSNTPSLLRARGGRTTSKTKTGVKSQSLVKDFEMKSGSLTHKSLVKEPSLRALKASKEDIEYGLPHSLKKRNLPKRDQGSVADNSKLVKSRRDPSRFFEPMEWGPNTASLEIIIGPKKYDREVNVNKRKAPLPFKKGGHVVANDWISDAVKKPGALRRTLKVKAGEKIPAAKLEKAEHSKNPTTRRRARLATTLSRFKRD